MSQNFNQKIFFRKQSFRLKSVQVMVRLHIFPIFSFLAKMLSFLCRKYWKDKLADHNLNRLQVIYDFSCFPGSSTTFKAKFVTSVAIHLNLLEANVNVTIGTLSKPSLCCSTFKGKVSPISIDIVFGQRANKKLVNDFKKNWGINLK